MLESSSLTDPDAYYSPSDADGYCAANGSAGAADRHRSIDTDGNARAHRNAYGDARSASVDRLVRRGTRAGAPAVRADGGR
jgi:hypothetical protein